MLGTILTGQLKTYPYGAATKLCELYDPATDKWSAATAMPHAAAGAATVALRDGRFAVIGGGAASLTTPSPTTAAVAYDPTTGRWDRPPGGSKSAKAGSPATRVRQPA